MTLSTYADVAAKSNAVTRIANIMPPAPSVSQLGILMLDGSGSMSKEVNPGGGTTKSEAVLKATMEFVEVLKASRIRDSFWLAATAFGTSTTSMLPGGKEYVKVADLNSTLIRSPTDVFPTQTNTDIALALSKAIAISRAFLADTSIPVESRYRKVVVVLLSDGQNNVGDIDDVYGEARDISSMWPLCTVAFGNDADINLLRGIVVDERFFLQTADSKKLRSFFINSTTLEKR